MVAMVILWIWYKFILKEFIMNSNDKSDYLWPVWWLIFPDIRTKSPQIDHNCMWFIQAVNAKMSFYPWPYYLVFFKSVFWSVFLLFVCVFVWGTAWKNETRGNHWAKGKSLKLQSDWSESFQTRVNYTSWNLIGWVLPNKGKSPPLPFLFESS